MLGAWEAAVGSSGWKIGAVVLAIVLGAGLVYAQVPPGPAPQDPVGAAGAGPASTPTTDAAPLAPTAADAPVQVDVQLDPPQLPLGGTLRYRATFRAPKGVRVYFPEQPAVDPFRLVPGSVQVVKRDEGDVAVTEVTLTLRPYRLGFRKVPAIEVPWLGPNGETGTVTIAKQRVRVMSLLANEAEPTLAPPGEPLSVVATNWPLVWGLVVFGSVVVAAALTLLVLWLLRGRRLRVPPPPPPRPPHEVALGKLAAIERDRLPEKGELMAYYVRISEAVREYLGGRYGFDGLVMTTTEILASLRDKELKGVPEARVQEFLDECDLVKFASFAPSPKEIEWLLQTAYALVRETMELAPEPAPAPVEVAPRERLARPLRRVYAALLDLAALSLPVGGLLVAGRLLAEPGYFVAAGSLGLLGVLLRDLPAKGSPGKALAGLRLTGPREGVPSQLVGRIARNVPQAVPFVGQTVELLVMAYDDAGRRLGDRLGQTRVLDLRPERGDGAALVGSLVALVVTAALVAVVPFVLL